MSTTRPETPNTLVKRKKMSRYYLFSVTYGCVVSKKVNIPLQTKQPENCQKLQSLIFNNGIQQGLFFLSERETIFKIKPFNYTSVNKFLFSTVSLHCILISTFPTRLTTRSSCLKRCFSDGCILVGPFSIRFVFIIDPCNVFRSCPGYFSLFTAASFVIL